MVKAINVWYLNFQEKGMVSVNKWKSLRFHSLHTRKSFQNFGCLTKQYCVKWILSRFSLNGYIFHMVFKGAKQIRCGSTNLPIFGTWICNECRHKGIRHYKLIFDCAKRSNKKPAKELFAIFTWNRVVKILICKIHKIWKNWHPFFFFKKLLFIVYFAVKVTTLIRFTNGFMNRCPTINIGYIKQSFNKGIFYF